MQSHVDINYNGPEFERFTNYFNAHLCVRSFLWKVKDLQTVGYDQNKESILAFPVERLEVDFLLNDNYCEFLVKVCNHLRINHYSYDSLLSELGTSLLEVFKLYIESQKVSVHGGVNREERLVLLEMPDLISDLLIMPLSQLHSTVLSVSLNFTDYLKAVGGDPNRFFLNPNGASPYFQYVMIWVACQLKIPQVPAHTVNGEGVQIVI